MVNTSKCLRHDFLTGKAYNCFVAKGNIIFTDFIISHDVVNVNFAQEQGGRRSAMFNPCGEESLTDWFTLGSGSISRRIT